MAGDYLRAIHRLLQGFRALARDEAGNHRTPVQILTLLSQSPPDSAQFCRYVSGVFDQIDGAEDIILTTNSLNEESKRGLLEATGALRRSLSVQLGNQLPHLFPNLDSTISLFSIIADLTSTPNSEIDSNLIAEFIEDIDQVIDRIEKDLTPDGPQRAILKHIRLFRIFLESVSIVGLDAAFEAYMDLCLKLKRREKNADVAAKNFILSIWPDIERWAGRLAILEQAYSNSAHLLEHAEHAVKLIGL